jgi:hypothetical protein
MAGHSVYKIQRAGRHWLTHDVSSLRGDAIDWVLVILG